MIPIIEYIRHFSSIFPEYASAAPWAVTGSLQALVSKQLKNLSNEFIINGNVAIHKSARVEEYVILKGPAIISADCFIGSHAYLRGGVYLGEKSSVGPGCEVKTSIILGSSLAHFNFVGDSILGNGVNLEAGAVIANHWNERADKSITVAIHGTRIQTGAEKFGALAGDNVKIGANAVLSPGTILSPGSVVKRLELVDQS